MARYPASRSASFVITLFGIVTNFVLAVQVLTAWRSLKWETESEWESSGGKWRVDVVKVIWGLLLVYFGAAVAVCTVGFVGVVKNKATALRFYRDYSIADFSFCVFVTIVGAYGSFRTSTRTGVCEEMSRQSELMRDMAEMGLSVENCERWFERAVMAFLAIMIIVIVVRLHFLLAVSNYYTHVCRHAGQRSPQSTASHTHSHTHSRSHSKDMQRIYLLPRHAIAQPSSGHRQEGPEEVMVYAPVPLHELSPEAAQDVRQNALEAWVKRGESHSHRHRHRSGSVTGRISLPIHPDEGLLPSYYDGIPASKD